MVRPGGLATSALLLALSACAPAREPWENPSAQVCSGDQRAFSGVIVAGSGPALPLARQVFSQLPELRVWIAESIGSGGAALALRDGAIDVGLSTRPLTPLELEPQFRERVIAQAPLALVTNAESSQVDFSVAELVALWRGERRNWPDGTPVVLLAREPGDSGEQAIARSHPTLFSAIRAACDEGRALELTTDSEMRDALLALDGAIGFLDLGVVRLEAPALKVHRIEGQTPEKLQANKTAYPYWRQIRTIWREPLDAPRERVVTALLAISVPHLRSLGYLPPEPEP